MLVRQSALDPTVTVIEVETGDAGPMVDLLETRGHGFTVLGIEQRMVVVDGRCAARGRRRTTSSPSRRTRSLTFTSQMQMRQKQIEQQLGFSQRISCLWLREYYEID